MCVYVIYGSTHTEYIGLNFYNNEQFFFKKFSDEKYLLLCIIKTANSFVQITLKNSKISNPIHLTAEEDLDSIFSYDSFFDFSKPIENDKADLIKSERSINIVGTNEKMYLYQGPIVKAKHELVPFWTGINGNVEEDDKSIAEVADLMEIKKGEYQFLIYFITNKFYIPVIYCTILICDNF